MTPLTTLTAIAAPLLRDNIDTDAIIPSREIRNTGKSGLAAGLFAGWRYRSTGTREPNPDFILNRPRYQGVQILLVGRNFGCGSSREHAVWALAEFGIRAVLAPSFGSIFFGNCIRNGILAARVPRDAVEEIATAIEENPTTLRLHIDVDAQTISLPDGRSWCFPLDGESKAMLMEGLHPVDLTLRLRDEIEAFLARDREVRPWVYLERLNVE